MKYVGLIFLLLCCSPCAGKVRIESLRCEYRNAPMGADNPAPLFSWRVQSDERGVCQRAYRILVASCAEKLTPDSADMWDSGRIESPRSVGIAYAGKKLESSTYYYWRVDVWTDDESAAACSGKSHWLTGLFHDFEWKGNWMGLERAFAWDDESFHSRLSARCFRNEFALDKKIRYAVAHICGAGYFELFINGNRIGDQVLAPIPSRYDNTLLYNTFDVSAALRQGRNAIGILLGNGYYYTMQQGYRPQNNVTFGYPKVRFTLVLIYEDGTRRQIAGHNRWKVTADGPIRSNNLYDGEVYDARKEMRGWSEPGFDASDWLPVDLVAADPASVKAQPTDGLAVNDRIAPVEISSYPGGGYLLDFGVNMTGWVRIKLPEMEKGDTLRIDYAEKLGNDGLLDKSNLRDAYARDIYIADSISGGEWAPHFVYHGFRYAVVTGLKAKPAADDCTGEWVYDKMAQIGSFTTDDERFNRVLENAANSIRGTYKGVPLDCPQRSKRLPWLGDRVMESRGETYLFDNNSVYEHWLAEMRGAQRADGCIPDVAPAFWLNYTDNVSWPALFVFGQKMLYDQFGNDRPMRDNYPAMKKWLAHIRDCYMEDGLIHRDRYGDWGVPPEDRNIKHSKADARRTDGVLISTAYYYRLMCEMSEIAGLVGFRSDSVDFRREASQVGATFHKKFYDDDSGCYGNNTVTANILPLAFGMVPDSEYPRVVANLRKIIMEQNGGHVSAGVVGLQWLMKTLTKVGMSDVAYRLATNSTYPSYGYMVERGATTIWEYWNGDSIVDSSHNHVMLLGDLLAWCWEDLAGIRGEMRPEGYRLSLAPDFTTPFNRIDGRWVSPCGPVVSSWRRSRGRIRWEIMIPPSASGYLRFRGADFKSISVDGMALSEFAQCKNEGWLVPPGKYRIEFQMKE